MKLTAEKVHNTFMSCLFNENEDTSNFKLCEGVLNKVGFNPEKLKESEQSIIEMLDCLPDSFKKAGGGGMSFLNMCDDKDDVQWTDFHQTMDELVCLGLAIEKLSYLMPREYWKILPGGMPYLLID